ncbi:TPA: hypothetical protein ACJIK4_002387, partial [Kluyvera cryocrescens]
YFLFKERLIHRDEPFFISAICGCEEISPAILPRKALNLMGVSSYISSIIIVNLNIRWLAI